jgi:hypothetical protein
MPSDVGATVVDVGVSLEADASLDDEGSAEAVRGAEHSHAPSTTLHPIDPVGLGPSEVLETVALGPNWAWVPAASSRSAEMNLTMLFVTSRV